MKMKNTKDKYTIVLSCRWDGLRYYANFDGYGDVRFTGNVSEATTFDHAATAHIALLLNDHTLKAKLTDPIGSKLNVRKITTT